jgi:hypothetical protein
MRPCPYCGRLVKATDHNGARVAHMRCLAAMIEAKSRDRFPDDQPDPPNHDDEEALDRILQVA